MSLSFFFCGGGGVLTVLPVDVELWAALFPLSSCLSCVNRKKEKHGDSGIFSVGHVCLVVTPGAET